MSENLEAMMCLLDHERAQAEEERDLALASAAEFRRERDEAARGRDEAARGRDEAARGREEDFSLVGAQ